MFTGRCYMLGTVGQFLLTVRAGEMAQGEKHMLDTCDDLSLTPQKLHKALIRVYACPQCQHSYGEMRSRQVGIRGSISTS